MPIYCASWFPSFRRGSVLPTRARFRLPMSRGFVKASGSLPSFANHPATSASIPCCPRGNKVAMDGAFRITGHQIAVAGRTVTGDGYRLGRWRRRISCLVVEPRAGEDVEDFPEEHCPRAARFGPRRETKFHPGMESYDPLPASCGTRYTSGGAEVSLFIEVSFYPLPDQSQDPRMRP